MKYVARAGISAALLAFATLASGCAENNESTADIKGSAPAEGTYPKSQADMQAQMKGGVGGMQSAGYPGANKAKAK